MQLFVTILHVFLCLSLILIILLQPGKEGAAAFGGSGGNQMYGPRGQGHFLGRATTVVAALFMLTSITLALYSGSRVSSDSDLEKGIEKLPGLDETEGFKIDLPASATSGSPTPPVPTGGTSQGNGAGGETPSNEAPGDEASGPPEAPAGTLDGAPAPQ